MKRIINDIVWGVIAFATFASCSEMSNVLSEKYTISGTSLQAVYGANMAFLKSTTDDQTVDSCEIIHGKFTMNGKVDSVQCAALTLGPMSVPLILENGDITVNYANSSLKVSGTPLNDKLYQFLGSRDSLMMLVQELPNKESKMILNGVSADERYKLLGEEEADLRVKIQDLDKEFISSNYDNVLGIVWFLYLCKQESMIFGFPTTSPMLEELYVKAPDGFKKSKDVAEFMKQVNSVE